MAAAIIKGSLVRWKGHGAKLYRVRIAPRGCEATLESVDEPGVFHWAPLDTLILVRRNRRYREPWIIGKPGRGGVRGQHGVFLRETGEGLGSIEPLGGGRYIAYSKTGESKEFTRRFFAAQWLLERWEARRMTNPRRRRNARRRRHNPEKAKVKLKEKEPLRIGGWGVFDAGDYTVVETPAGDFEVLQRPTNKIVARYASRDDAVAHAKWQANEDNKKLRRAALAEAKRRREGKERKKEEELYKRWEEDIGPWRGRAPEEIPEEERKLHH